MALLQDLDKIVAPLRDVDYIDGVMVFGSHARRDVHPASDVDLLLLYRRIIPAREIKKKVRKKLSTTQAQISAIFFTAEDLLKEIDRRPSFAAHLADEGVFLYCWGSCSSVKARLDGYAPSAEDLARELYLEMQALDLFRDITRFNEQFVSSLARLYSIARSIVIIKLLQDEVHEYSWWKIFHQYSTLHPELRSAVEQLTLLRPYYEHLVGRRDTLPDALRSMSVANAATVRASIEAISAVAST